MSPLKIGVPVHVYDRDERVHKSNIVHFGTEPSA